MNSNKIFLAILVLIQLVYCSCTDSQGTYDEFIEDGDIVYRSAPKDLKGYSGKNAALLTWKLTNPFLVSQCIISDDNNNILAEIPVVYEDSLKFSYRLDDLEEKTYTFSVYSLDDSGNQSIKKNVIVDVFGDKYAKQLKTNRVIVDITRSEDNSVCVFLNKVSSTKNRGTNMIYTTVNGASEVKEVGDVSFVILDNVNINSNFIFEDLWLPNSTAFEVLKSPSKTYESTDLPHGLRRDIDTIYRDIDNRVHIHLTPSAEPVYKSFISYGEKTVEIFPSVNQVVIEDMPLAGTLSLVTSVLPEGEGTKLFYSEKSLFDIGKIICDR